MTDHWEPYPAPLLADHVARARRRAAGSLTASALRTQSWEARHVLAHAAGDGARDLSGWLRAAHAQQVADIPTGCAPADLADLARVVSLQQRDPDDTADGLALYELARAGFGPGALPPAHQQLHADLAYAAGDLLRTRALLATYPGIPAPARAALLIDLDNPFVHPGTCRAEEWLPRLRAFALPGYPELRLADPVTAEPVSADPAAAAPAPFDRLTAGHAVPPAGRSRVSVVVTSYCPGTPLLTAVRSLCHQTWGDLEILVVDDGSPAQYAPVLDQCRALDDRVDVIRLPRNRGTHHARNVGLDAASGVVVTFQDQDDWSHPLRLEHQVRPLLHGGPVVATLADGLWVTDDLSLTRPGTPPVAVHYSSLMVRREEVRQRLGYVDTVRRGPEREYPARIAAVFGERAVQRLTGHAYALVRRTPDALSAQDFRPGWRHPARDAYRRAYRYWHRRVAAGAAEAYMSRETIPRPFPAPPALGSAGAPVRHRTYDVVFVGDWRRCDAAPASAGAGTPEGVESSAGVESPERAESVAARGRQESVLEEIRALAAHGLRVGVVHLPELRSPAAGDAPWCESVQELVHAGTVDEVLLTDDTTVSVLIVCGPAVLQFPPPQPAQLRAARVLILADRAPRDGDGTEVYVPQACTVAAQRLFGGTPQWCPRDPGIRNALRRRLTDGRMAPFDLSPVIDCAQWAMARRAYPGYVPVVGRRSHGSPREWLPDREALAWAYPADGGVDVRILGDSEVARARLGTARLPATWLAYADGDLAPREFLHQLDFYVHFPHPDEGGTSDRAVLEALAAGCVTVLPPVYADTYGDAAVYCAPQDVRTVVDTFATDPERYQEQSTRAAARVAERFSHDSYTDLVRTLLPRASGRAAARTGR